MEQTYKRYYYNKQIMTIKEILIKLKDTYNEAVAGIVAPVVAAVEPVAPTSYTLQDGSTVVTIDKLEAGGQVLPAPSVEGSITLQDGTVVAHDAMGVIVSVTPVAAAEPVAPLELSTPVQMRAFLDGFAVDQPADLSKIVTVLKAVFEQAFGWELRQAAEQATRAAAIEVYKSGFSAQDEAIKGLIEAVQKLSEVEIATPLAQDKAFEDMTPLEQFRFNKNK
jgi:hypothetical protein